MTEKTIFICMNKIFYSYERRPVNKVEFKWLKRDVAKKSNSKNASKKEVFRSGPYVGTESTKCWRGATYSKKCFLFSNVMSINSNSKICITQHFF